MILYIMIWRNILIEKDNILKMIGLAVKARKASTGTMICLEDIKKDRIKLLFVASDCSENTREKVLNAKISKQIEIIEIFSKEQLGSIIGKEEISVVGIKDSNFAKGIRSKITKEN
ncbi:MAG TPA: ribosomal L7Ae/L30e/S12e/Gadd45 family protein [Clostridia bacterium]|nr:ribosomal L7Ae/L30e/S12e/Gadd45 family protein [Clostridia bacterium]